MEGLASALDWVAAWMRLGLGRFGLSGRFAIRASSGSFWWTVRDGSIPVCGSVRGLPALKTKKHVCTERAVCLRRNVPLDLPYLLQGFL